MRWKLRHISTYNSLTTKKFISLFYLVFIIIIVLTKKPSRPPKKHFIELDDWDVYLISAYYYPKSQSLGNNSIALIFTGHYELIEEITHLHFLAGNETHKLDVKAPLELFSPHKVCVWVGYFTTALVLPNTQYVSIRLGEELFKIPLRKPVYNKHDVVSCISPLFANDQWQLLVLAAHTYHRFGSYIHLYVRSMVKEIYDLMKLYEKEGYLEMDPWPRIHLSSVPLQDFNPNLNVEFRNQAAAQSDCLLKYKESANFISFVDLDDIIFPRVAGTYADEYRELFGLNKIDTEYDNYGNEIDTRESGIGYLYYKKHNVHVESHSAPGDFSLTQLFSSVSFRHQEETGKVVVRPQYVNHTWIHWPLNPKPGFIGFTVPTDVNVISHFKMLETVAKKKNLTILDPNFEPEPSNDNKMMPLITKNAIRTIQEDFENMLMQFHFLQVWENLPTTAFYFNYIKKCFDDTFYKLYFAGQLNKIKCPGPDRCKIPKDTGILCGNSRAEYHSSSSRSNLNVHYGTNAHFLIQNDCIF